MIRIKSDREVGLMREAGRVVAESLDLIRERAGPGVTTGELDECVAKHIKDAGGIAAFKGYRGFPAHMCTSVNEEIVHGIPGDRILKEGDILSVDVGVKLDGYFGDAAVTIAIGKISKKAGQLIRACKDALELATGMLTPGRKLSELCTAIQQNVENKGYSVIREYVGHGIGHKMHEQPQVPNFALDVRKDGDVMLKRGMVLALEPMICTGGYDVEVLSDRWTAVTRDRGLAAHFEHTVAVREGGGWVLTEV